MRIEINEFIVIDSNICHGQPTFKGTRIMVSIVFEMLRDGASTKEILEAYPSLTKEHIKASLEFAARIAERSFIIPLPE